MKSWTLSALIAAALALVIMAIRQAQASTAAGSTSDRPFPSPFPWPMPDTPSFDTSDDSSGSTTSDPSLSTDTDTSEPTPAPPSETATDDANQQLPSTLESIVNNVTQFALPTTAPTDQAAANEHAFLAMLRHSEGTDREDDPYRVTLAMRHDIVGIDGERGTVDDFADHPAITGEWPGAWFTYRSKNGAQAKGFSTAAGAYQFLKGTWIELRDKLSLPDFGPGSQDRAALELVRERGALADVRAGRFTVAIKKCSPTWASLPGAGYGQHENAIASLQAAYTAAGGTLET